MGVVNLMGVSPLQAARVLARRLLFAALLTAVLLTLASAALSFTTAPAFVSLLIEPFSLLLTPGLLISLAIAGRHNEVSASAVLLASACLYFVAISLVLTRWSGRKRTHSPSR